jgi:hypothetical protein
MLTGPSQINEKKNQKGMNMETSLSPGEALISRLNVEKAIYFLFSMFQKGS